MATYEELKQRAEEVRTETKAKANSAERVGGLLVDIIQEVEADESVRDKNENIRQSNEEQRKSDEAKRTESEQQRTAAEAKRNTDELSRQSNETDRKEAEAARVEAEQGRVDAENQRSASEEARSTAESGRVTAENARVAAENSRVSAEQTREQSFTAKVGEVDTAIKNCNTATEGAERVDATITEANVLQVTDRNGTQKTLDLVGQADASSIKADIKEIKENYNVTIDVVGKIIDLPSKYGIIKQKYLHVENRNNTNADAALYCVYIDKACTISASGLANMQDGYATRCWAAFTEREVNNDYLVAELSDGTYTPRRTGVSCELNIPDTIKMVCFSSLTSQKPEINVTKAITNDELENSIKDNTTLINDRTTVDKTYSGSNLSEICKRCYYRLGLESEINATQGFLYYPRKGTSVSIRNITSDANPCPSLSCFNEKIEITGEISKNYTQYLYNGWSSRAITKNTCSYENLSFPEGVKMVYIYSPINEKLEIVEHITSQDEIASVRDEIASVREGEVYHTADLTSDNSFDFDEKSIIARFFSDRITHRNRFINENSRKIYWSPNNGNDENDGLTESKPVKSYNKVKEMLTDGSELYIERGSVITELCKFNFSGLLITTYGSELSANPVFDNFVETKSSDWVQVEGYEHIYKLTRHLEASGSNINSVQVAIDGHNISDISSVIISNATLPNVSNCYINTKEQAMERLSANVNEAWCSCYEGGYSWEEGDYDFYISLNDTPSDHKIEVTNHIARCLIEFGNYCDVRRINTRGSAGKDGWNISSNTYMEDCHIYDHCHHGFLQGSNGGVMRMYNCSAEAPKGAIGYQFHIFAGSQEKINNITDMFIGCNVVSKNQYGSCFSGHGSSSMGKGLNVYVINSHSKGANSFIGDTSLINNLYVKGCRIEDVGTIGWCAAHTIISDIKGSVVLKNHGSVFQSPYNLSASNIILHCKSLNGISGIIFDNTKSSFSEISGCNIIDSKILVDKVARDSLNNAQTYNIFAGYKGANFTDCLFVVTYKGGQSYDEKLYYKKDADAGGHNFNKCLFFGTQNNGEDNGENKFLTIGDLKKSEYLFNKLYTDNGIIKIFV